MSGSGNVGAAFTTAHQSGVSDSGTGPANGPDSSASAFSVGDRVRLVGGPPAWKGSLGTVVPNQSSPYWDYVVRLDAPYGFAASFNRAELEAEEPIPYVLTDLVNAPTHYTVHPSGVECIDITEHMNFCLGNAIKYIWRAGLKSDDPVLDLRKAIFYIDREITRISE